MKQKFKEAYMDTAKRFAELSHAIRLKVGSIIVKDDRIISIGFNGTPKNWDNNCEHREYQSASSRNWLDAEDNIDQWPYEDDKGRYRLTTKQEVLHAEMNAISKIAKTTESADGATMFVTHQPCIHCAKIIYQSGITAVYYGAEYRDPAGVRFLEECGVLVEKIEDSSL
jgi:dCMP deaminase